MFSSLIVLLLVLISFVMIYPLIYVLSASLSEPILMLKNTGPIFLPKGFSLEAYTAVLKKPEILTGYKNTIFYVVAGTTVNMLLTISLGYVLSRKGLFWNKYIMMLIVFTMYFNGGLVPTYLIVQNLGLINSRLAVFIPTAISTYNLIIMRTAFMALPVEIEEAAKVDGARPLTILARIIFPLAAPTIAVITLYYAVGQWNSWFQAVLYLRNQETYPLQLFLREILINNDQTDMLIAVNDEKQMALSATIKYATIIVATLPILCLYPFLQKYFTKGILVGAVKG